jgi:glycosyltransferase involved in cell wall biosynthesis
MVTIGKILTSQVVVDAHNEGLRPFHSKYNLLLPVYRLIQRRADLTIVSNRNLAREVEKNAGKPFVLQDRIPDFNDLKPVKLRGKHNVVFICTFEKDEPYQEVIRSARLLNQDIFLYITGRFEKAPRRLIEESPENIVFTGYLSDSEYASLLYSCDAIMDLTLMENCLVCGAYESVALGKPLILSNTSALRNYFSSGAVYTENNAECIAPAINEALQRQGELAKEVVELRNRLRGEWESTLLKLANHLEDLDLVQNRLKSN